MNETPKITLSNASHRETPVVKVEFAYSRELIDALKARTNARWSATMNCWYIPKDKFDLGKFFTAMRPVTWIDYSAKLARICNPCQFRDYKKFTSKTIIKSIQENSKVSRKKWLLKQFQNPDGVQFWEPENHPVELWSNAVINQKLDYIHQNPVKEGLVFRAEDYMYSSAVDYAGRKGLLDVIVIE